MTTYLDNNATTAIAPEVIAAMEPYFHELWANPSSMHLFGGQLGKHIREARERVAAFINAEPDEIIFTSCGTESDNTAIFGVEPKRVITSKVEHPAVLGPCKFLQARGVELEQVGVDNLGNLKLDELEDALARHAQKSPRLLSLMWANNETGVIFPIKKAAEKAKAAGYLVHTDAVQAAGKIKIDVKEVPVDFLAVSGHKLHAPKGIGFLFARRGTPLNAYLIGGHQEEGRRGGTENVPYIMGLAAACDLATKHLSDGSMERTRELRDRLENGLLATCPDTSVNGDRQNRVPNTANISFSFIEGEAMLYHLSDEGICASSGSACSSGSLEPSHVIMAMGTPFTQAHGSIRFSLSAYTKPAEIDRVLEVMPKIVERLRALSPFV